MSITYATHIFAYLNRIALVQDAVQVDLTGLALIVDDIMSWSSNVDLNTNPAWQYMDRKLSHIERTYRRL